MFVNHPVFETIQIRNKAFVILFSVFKCVVLKVCRTHFFFSYYGYIKWKAYLMTDMQINSFQFWTTKFYLVFNGLCFQLNNDCRYFQMKCYFFHNFHFIQTTPLKIGIVILKTGKVFVLINLLILMLSNNAIFIWFYILYNAYIRYTLSRRKYGLYLNVQNLVPI